MLQWKSARLIGLLVTLGSLAAAFGNWGWESLHLGLVGRDPVSPGAKMPPRLAAVVLPVGFLGSRGRRGGRDFVRRLASRRGDAGGDRRPARGVDARRALPGPARRDRHRRRLARLRLLHGRDRALRLGGGRDRRPRGADHAHRSSTGRRSASSTTRRCSQSPRWRPDWRSRRSAETTPRWSSRKCSSRRSRTSGSTCC